MISSSDRPVVEHLAEYEYHGGAVARFRIHVGGGRGFHHLRAGHPCRAVVDHAVRSVDQHLVLHAGGVREHGHFLGVRARHAGGGARRDGSRRAGGHDAPFGAGEFRETLSRSFHELVHVDVMTARLIHCRLHFRQHERAAQDRHGAPAVDDRADADGFVGGDGALRFRDRPARTRKPGDRRPRAPDKSTARDGTEFFLHDGIPSKKKKRTVLAKAAKGAKEKKVQSHESKVESQKP